MSNTEFDKQKELFSKNLKLYLELQDYSQTDLANKIGVSTATASDWCNGKKMPRMDKIVAICKWLGIKKSDLLEDYKPKTLSEIRDSSELTQLKQDFLKLNLDNRRLVLQMVSSLLKAENKYEPVVPSMYRVAQSDEPGTDMVMR